MSNITVSPEEIRKVLTKAEEELKQCQAEGLYFEVNDAAETIARCYRLLEDTQQAQRYFTMAAWASLVALDIDLRQGETDSEAQWGYLFEALWLYYQAGNQQKAQELVRRLDSLLDRWPEPIPLLQRMQASLIHYVTGDVDKARVIYQRFRLNRYEGSPYHPEVKLLKAGLYDDQRAACKAIEAARQEIAANEIQPWYANNLEYDLISIAEALLGEVKGLASPGDDN